MNMNDIFLIHEQFAFANSNQPAHDVIPLLNGTTPCGPKKNRTIRISKIELL
jgi:hypothetical protein